ncbi:hypothetical protein C8R44DRAFT_892736 [Mycena epipterygia]|nr:hypothetical protein C8R44DRAFT_892736 [Mycena epipterygia]
MSAHTQPPDDPNSVESSTLSSSGKKVKAELKPPSKIKECSSATGSEVSMLKALLAQKAGESLKRELKLRTDLLEVENQNKRLKQKRAADATRIQSLEAELARMKKIVAKDDKTDIQGGALKKERKSEGVISVLDSDSEDEHHKDRSTADVQTAPSTTSTSPVADPSPQPPSRRQRPSQLQDAWSMSSPEPENAQSVSQNDMSSQDVQVKDEVIHVVIKNEGEPDQFKRVTLIKSEDGNFDIWNVDGFGLGPTIEVDEKYTRGFTRKVISDAFGGGHVRCDHHWNPKPGQERKPPFITFNRSWNNALPVNPGTHGMGFFSLTGCPVKPQPINIFVGEGMNIRLSSLGEIAPHHISLLPSLVLNNWVNGMLSSQWGKSWIEDTNKDLAAPRKVKSTFAGVSQALHDGRLTISFTILQCVGYPKDWFERLLYYEKNPKPKTSKKRRRPKAQGSPKKQTKTPQKGKSKVKEESSSEDEDDGSRQVGVDSDNSNSEYLDGPRQIATLPTRTSPRKLARAVSVEL